MGAFGEAIEVEAVDFVPVPTRDVARARRFYGDVSGAPGEPRPAATTETATKELESALG